MINSELKNNEQGNNGVDTCIFHKQPPITTKKTVLTDVQNDNRVLRNHRESSFSMDGGPTADKVKLSETPKLISESPTSHPFPPLPDRTATKEHLMYTSKKSEFVTENGKAESNTDKNVSSPLLKRFSNMQQEIPQKKTRVLEGNGAGPAENDCLKVTSNVPLSTDSKRVDDQNWEERYIHLQNFLKMCDDESTYKDHIQKLRRLSPAELSIYAVELERRSIQLTIEEGKELQRMKALKILEKSATPTNPLQKSQPSQSKK